MKDLRRIGRGFTYGAFVVLSLFFVLFGVLILIASYSLKDPFAFLMTFFASNLIILISAVGAVAFVIRIVQLYRNMEKE